MEPNGAVAAPPVEPGLEMESPAGSSRSSRQTIAQVLSRLATEIGPRNVYYYEALCRAAEYIENASVRLATSPSDNDLKRKASYSRTSFGSAKESVIRKK